MRREILQQPDAIGATLAAETDKIREFAARLRKEEIRQVLLVARGTSDNAAMYARYIFPIVVGKLASLVAPSLLTVYDADLDLRDTLVLGISQSGESVAVLEFLDHARSHGALTCGLTNTSRAAISEVAEVVLCTHAREEESVPATKTYTTALAVLHQLAALWAGDLERAKRILEVPKWIGEVLAMESQIEERAERFRFMSACAVVARGLSLTAALETALKLAQCCYVVPASYSGADFLHGPIATIEPGFPCFAYAPQGKALQSMNELLDALRERQAETIVISNVGRILDKATVCLPIPDMPEEFAPMVAIVVGQLLALYTALHKGIDPDEPRGVTKVTLTL
jgi:glucosamine--fructose-6-phosphate aminotransferase (isomerizing)